MDVGLKGRVGFLLCSRPRTHTKIHTYPRVFGSPRASFTTGGQQGQDEWAPGGFPPFLANGTGQTGHRGIGGGVCGYVCVCTWVREGERERGRVPTVLKGKVGFPFLSVMTKVTWDISEKSEPPYAAWISLSIRIYPSPKMDYFWRRAKLTLGIYLIWISEIRPRVEESWKVEEKLFQLLAVTHVALQLLGDVLLAPNSRNAGRCLSSPPPHFSPHPPFSHIWWPLSFHCSFSNVKSVLSSFLHFNCSRGIKMLKGQQWGENSQDGYHIFINTLIENG